MLRLAEIFELHLFELARAKSEIARVNFVPERFPDLGDAERQFFARNIEDVLELHENCLGRFRAQIGHARFVFGCADIGFEHEVKRPGLGQIFAATGRTLFNAIFLRKLVRPKPGLAGSAVNHRIAKRLLVPARFPYRPVHQNRAIHSDDVVALVDHDAPPVILDIALQLDPERPVIPQPIETAVDFARLKNEAAPFAQANDFFHALAGWLGLGHRHTTET